MVDRDRFSRSSEDPSAELATDPPRNWRRAGALAGVWAVLLLGGAWVVPAFAEGGDQPEEDARDQPATTARQAAARYLENGVDGDFERAGEALCDESEPQVTPADLDALREEYAERLGGYPEVEVSTDAPVSSAGGSEVVASVSFIHENLILDFSYTVTVVQVGDSYCVSEAVFEAPPEATDEESQRELASDFLNAITFDRDPDDSFQCDGYEGIDPAELMAAVEAWEDTNGDTLATASRIDGEDVTESDEGTVFPYNVVLRGPAFEESYAFDVTVSEGCVSALSGGEGLL